MDLKDYLEYFEKIWVNGSFKFWKFFNRESNTFLTNNITESLNALIKRELTERKRLDVIEFLQAFIEYLKTKKMKI